MKFKRLKLSISYLFCALALFSYLSYAPVEDELISVMKKADGSATIYLLDQDNILVPLIISIELQDEESMLKEAFRKMSQPLEDSEFKAVLPLGTQLLDAQIDEDTIVLNFNEKLLDYEPQMEVKLLSAVVFTATSLHQNHQVVLQINGETLSYLPYRQTSLKHLDRRIGINSFELNHSSLHDTTVMNVYYTKEIANRTYYVPMSKRVPNSLTLDEALDEIGRRVSLHSKLKQPLAIEKISTKGSEINEEGLILHLDDSILSEEKTCKKEALDTLLLSIKETLGYDKVKIYVDGVCVNGHGSNDELAGSYFEEYNRFEF